jgi:hypothetical protein
MFIIGSLECCIERGEFVVGGTSFLIKLLF